MNEIAPGPVFDFVILADRAEVINGKLYMMGGAWDGIVVRAVGDAAAFSIAAGLLVPWHATNVEHAVELRLEDADARQLAAFRLGFTVGRPAAMPPGTRQRFTFALPVTFTFPAPGAYVVVCAVGEAEKRVAFQVQLAPAPPPAPVPPTET